MVIIEANSTINEFKSIYTYRGRWALRLALQILGIGSGDKVAVQAFTCTAVPEAVSSIGANPLFIDVTEDGVNMCPSDLRRKIDKNVKIVVLQHTYGSSSNIDILFSICEKFGILVIEDCCHLPFSNHTLKALGTRSVAKFFSFEWGKPLPVGIGGALVFTDQAFYERCTKFSMRLKKPGSVDVFRIEVQFLLFKILYRPEFYFKLKKLFHIAGNLGLAISNHKKPGIDEPMDEMYWTISPLVRRRIEKMDLCDFDTNLRIRVKNFLNMIRSENSISSTALSLDSDYLMRLPVHVKNKDLVLVQARLSNFELADWYSTPVHPYSTEECLNLGWDVRSCSNALHLSKHIVTIPLNKEFSITKTCEFLKVCK